MVLFFEYLGEHLKVIKMNTKKLTYLLRIKEHVGDLFVWSVWGDGEQLFCRVHDNNDRCYFVPFSTIFK